MREIVTGVQYLHKCGIVHCDLKPQNILVNKVDTNILSKQWTIKITDFGMARTQTFNNNYCRFDPEAGCMVCTSWYRPIDLLLGSCVFDDRCDIWALGCIFAETAIGSPIFASDTEDGIIYKIITIFGSDGLDVFKNYSSKRFHQNQFVKYQLPEDLKKIISRMLSYSPYDRPSINQILEDDYFTQ